MALAFEKAQDPWSASLCLRRYLKLQGFGPYAADARQRLARLQSMQPGPGGMPGPGAAGMGGVPGGAAAAPAGGGGNP